MSNHKTELETKLETIEAELQKFIAKSQEEYAKNGAASTETKTAVEKLSTEAKSIYTRLEALEKDALSRLPGSSDGNAVKSIGEIFTESEGFKALTAGSAARSGKINIGHLHKTTMINATGQNQPLVQAYRVPGIITPPTQRLTMRDLFPAIPVTSNLIEYVREASFTNNAGYQANEGDVKPESALTFEMLFKPVQTLAHWLPISVQLLSDAPALQGYINTRLTYGLKLKEEKELLVGTGANGAISGIVTNACAYKTSANAKGDTRIDTIHKAGEQLEKTFYPWDFIVMNVSDWAAIERIKKQDGDYLFANPQAVNTRILWGRPVVPTPAMDEGSFLVGSSMAATIWDRRDATIEISREHSDFFTRNLAAILAEERLALTVQIPDALVYGEFPEEEEEKEG